MGNRGNPNWTSGTSGNPTGKRKLLDGFVNQYTGHGTAADRRMYTRHSTRAVVDIQAIDMRRGNWLAKRLCELLPSECFRRAYTLKLDDKKKAEDVMSVVESLGVNAKIVEAGQKERESGGSALFPVLEGALDDLSEPLELSNPRILAVKAIHVLEPRELQPVSWYTDIQHPKYRKPERYRLYSISGGAAMSSTNAIIHESRMAILPGSRVTAESLPGQRLGWGDSALTPVEDVINDFGLSWGSAAAILHTFSQRVLKLNGLMEMLARKDGPALVEKRMQIADLYRSALRTEVIDGEDSLEHLVTSISGLPDLLVQFAQIVSAASDIPMTRLFGMSPAGMNATGEFDQDGWHERIANEQTIRYTAIVEWLIRLLLLSSNGPTGGNEPDVWSVEWKPLKQQNEKQIADTRKITAETDQIYYEMGLPPEGILKDRFGGDTYSMETTFDAAAFAAQKSAEDQIAEEMRAAEAEAKAEEPADNEEPPE